MRAISLWQPYASLWLSPYKLHETRHWSTQYRGPLAVHAAKRAETVVDDRVEFLLRAHFGRDWARTLPRGALIGVLNLDGCERTEKIYPLQPATADDYACGNFAPGRYGWRRGSVFRLLSKPIPYIGRQGFFNVPDEILRVAA